MAIQITNNLTTIDIYYDGNDDKYSVHKVNITLEKSGDYVVIVDSGRVPAKEYKVLYSDVTNPRTYSDADLLYADLVDYVNTEQAGAVVNIEANSDAVILNRNTYLLMNILEEQQLTNKLLKKIYNPE